jgi:RNA polymerase sigma-70 factor (ECF subfamily)
LIKQIDHLKGKAALSSHDRDEELARKRAAVAELYETHFERVARYVAVRIGNMDEAEDLASEVFVRALRSVKDYKETGAPLEAWVFRIAHNLVVDHLRSRSRRPSPVPLDEDAPVASQHNPGEDLESQEEVRQLQQAMAQLTPAQRQVLTLRFSSGMTSEQVAEVMGKKAGAVREMQSAGIKKLRQILDRR